MTTIPTCPNGHGPMTRRERPSAIAAEIGTWYDCTPGPAGDHCASSTLVPQHPASAATRTGTHYTVTYPDGTTTTRRSRTRTYTHALVRCQASNGAYIADLATDADAARKEAWTNASAFTHFEIVPITATR